MPVVLITAVMALLAVGGCAPDQPGDGDTTGEAPTTSNGDPTVDDGSAADDSSTNGSEGRDDEAADEFEGLAFTSCQADDLTVDYPSSWTVYEGEDVPPCRIFHPEPIDEFQGESLHYAARLYIDPVTYEDATHPHGEELSRQQTTVDGHNAMIIERRSQGDALLPEDERSYTYTVDLDGAILVATTTTVGDTDYGLDQRVLDQMMDTISIDVET